MTLQALGFPVHTSRLIPRSTVLLVNTAALGVGPGDRLIVPPGAVCRIEHGDWWGTFADTLEALTRDRIAEWSRS